MTMDSFVLFSVYKFLKESITKAHISAFSHVEGSEYHTIHGTPIDSGIKLPLFISYLHLKVLNLTSYLLPEFCALTSFYSVIL